MPATVYVYKNPLGDCTNGGISSGVDRLTLMNVEGPATPSLRAPPAWLKVRNQNPFHDVIIVPCNPEGTGPTKHWTMYGGNIVDVSDSRLRETFQQATVEALRLTELLADLDADLAEEIKLRVSTMRGAIRISDRIEP